VPPRGRRDPGLLVPTTRAKASSGIYIATGRPLKFGEYELPPGVEVPNAGTWPRVEAWVNARRIREIKPGENYVLFSDYQAKADEEREQEEREEAERAEALALEAQEQEQLQGALREG
jgi:hypothetical protein